MEELNTGTTMIETHSTIHKTDLQTTGLVSSDINTDSLINDVLVPLNGSELNHQHTESSESSPLKNIEDDQNIKNVDIAILNGKDLESDEILQAIQGNLAQESEMELHSNKDGEMDVESLMKDNGMDVDLEDQMNVDNNGDLNPVRNDTVRIRDKSNELFLINDQMKLDNLKSERNVNDRVNSETLTVKETNSETNEIAESLEKTDNEKIEDALNSLGHNESAIKNIDLISDHLVKGSLEVSFQDLGNESGNLRNPLHVSESDIPELSLENRNETIKLGENISPESENITNSQESRTEIDTLLSDLEKNISSSQGLYVSESLIKLSENLNSLDSEQLNLNSDCSERTDFVIAGNDMNEKSVPESGVNVMGSDEVSGNGNKEIEDFDGEKLIDDLINFNDSLVQENEPEEVDHSSGNNELLLDSIKDSECQSKGIVANEAEEPSKENSLIVNPDSHAFENENKGMEESSEENSGVTNLESHNTENAAGEAEGSSKENLLITNLKSQIMRKLSREEEQPLEDNLESESLKNLESEAEGPSKESSENVHSESQASKNVSEEADEPSRRDSEAQPENKIDSEDEADFNKSTDESGNEEEESIEKNKFSLLKNGAEDEVLIESDKILEKPAEAMDVDTDGAPAESMDVDPDDVNDVEMHDLSRNDALNSSKQNVSSGNEQSENLAKTDNISEITKCSVLTPVRASTVADNSENVAEELSSAEKEGDTEDISEMVAGLDDLFECNSPTSRHNSSAETLVDEELQKDDGPERAEVAEPAEVAETAEAAEPAEVPFGILEATSIPPTEFESMESTAVNDAEANPKEQSSVSNLSESAEKVLNEERRQTRRSKISVKTIKQEKLDFNIKEEVVDVPFEQITFQESLDIKGNVSGSTETGINENKKKKKKKGSCPFAYSKQRKSKVKRHAAQGAPGTLKPAGNPSAIAKKVNQAKKVVSGKQSAAKKTVFPVINLGSVNKNALSNQNAKRSRSSLNSFPVSSNPSSSAKKPRISLPNLRMNIRRTSGKRLLRSAVEITDKIQDIVNDRLPDTKIVTKVPKAKPSQVARKSTTHVKKVRSVAVKRGKPYPRAQREPEPIFVDTNFGSQDIDMFINENDEEDSIGYHDPSTSNRKSGRYDHPKSKSGIPRKKLRPCEVVIERMPIIDRLLPAKKEPEKLEPNICEICDPKRIFLSKSSLADHIKAEHLRNSSDTMVIPFTENVTLTRKEADDVKPCSFCKRPFHSLNRLVEHMKTCKSEVASKKFLNNIPGIDLTNLNKSVTISYAKRNEGGASPSTNHVCKICNRKFLMATGLKSHMKTHKPAAAATATSSKSTPQKPGKLTCDICDKNFQLCSDLVEHMTFHSLPSEKEKNILITNLSKISNVEINVENRVETSEDSESDGNLSCDFSDFSYEDRIKTRPKIDFSPNKCHECGRVFTIKAVYDRHVGLISKISNLNDPYKCPICDLETKFRCKLGAHLETHNSQPEEPLICKKCNKTFRCENNLIRHELEHEGKLKVNCQYCSLSFSAMSDLYSHQGDCKFKSNEYKCNLCKRVFTAKWRLDLHMKTDEKHGTDPQQPNTYFCDQCGREFKHLSVLKRHVDSRCGTEPLYQCPDCDKKYFSQGSLASHKRTQHSTEKNFMCQYCSKDFFTKHQLHRHELRHNPDVRPYRCKYPNCDKTYRQPDSLRAHECEHTGVYPYACEFCGLQFSNVKSLKLHRKSANHWSDVEPNKVVTQACRQKYLAGRKEQRGKERSEEEEIDPEGHEDEPKNLVVNDAQFDGVYGGERVAVPQYSTLQPFTVNHLMHHNQQNSVLVQAPHPLTSYTQAIENYFVIAASQQEPMNGPHHHSMMN